MKMYYINVNGNSSEVVDIENSLETYYKLLGCRTVEYTCRSINKKYFDIICDEEGLFKQNNRISAIDTNKEPQLVGNCLICNFDLDKGTEVGLSDKDIEIISQRIVRATIRHDNIREMYPLIMIDSAE